MKPVEVRRKLVHLILGIVVVLIINSSFSREMLLAFFTLLLLMSLIMSMIARIMRPPFLITFLTYFDKPEDLKYFPAKGAVYYLIGVIAALWLFQRDIASASVLILALGDPAAHLVGKYYGKNRLIINPRKLLEGTLAGTFMGTIGASLFVPFPLAFFGASMGMIAEAIELEFMELDDNFYIPFVSGTVMTIIMNLL